MKRKRKQCRQYHVVRRSNDLILLSAAEVVGICQRPSCQISDRAATAAGERTTPKITQTPQKNNSGPQRGMRRGHRPCSGDGNNMVAPAPDESSRARKEKRGKHVETGESRSGTSYTHTDKKRTGHWNGEGSAAPVLRSHALQLRLNYEKPQSQPGHVNGLRPLHRRGKTLTCSVTCVKCGKVQRARVCTHTHRDAPRHSHTSPSTR